MLGFGALGEFALGEGPNARPRGGGFTQFSSPIKKAALSVALAGSFSGFLAPPPAQAARSFTAFSQAAPKKAVQAASWGFLSPPVQPPRPIFSSFSVPQPVKAPPAYEQPNPLFEVTRPSTVTISFSSFDQSVPSSRTTHAVLLGQFSSFVPPEQIDVTSRRILQDPIDYYMEGLPQFRGLGHTFEQMRGEAKTEKKVTTRKGGRISKDASSFNVRTDKRGYD